MQEDTKNGLRRISSLFFKWSTRQASIARVIIAVPFPDSFPTAIFYTILVGKTSLIFAFWQGLWVPDGIKYGAKNRSV